MYTFLVIIHLIVAGILVLVVLLQSGKAGDLASTFGAAGSQTAFGTRSAATLLTKATAVAAAVFMLTSLSLSILSLRTTGTIMEDAPPVSATEAQQSAVPAAPPAEEGSQSQPQTESPAEEPPPGQ